MQRGIQVETRKDTDCSKEQVQRAPRCAGKAFSFSHFTRNLGKLVEQKSSRCPFKIITSWSLGVLWNRMPRDSFKAKVDTQVDDKHTVYYVFYLKRVFISTCCKIYVHNHLDNSIYIVLVWALVTLRAMASGLPPPPAKFPPRNAFFNFFHAEIPRDGPLPDAACLDASGWWLS